MSPLGSWWKERMPRSTKYIFCDEASQIDQKLDGRVEKYPDDCFPHSIA